MKSAPSILSIHKILLVGCGAVGEAIANIHLANDMDVVIADASSDSIVGYVSRLPDSITAESTEPPIPGLFAKRLVVKKTSESATQNSLLSQAFVDDRPWLVIESIIERMDMKQKLMCDLQTVLGQESIFCSNTSTLSIHHIGALMKDASRLAGMHFFMPVQERSGVEVIASSTTAPTVIERVLAHCITLGKEPFQVEDTPGFVVNRMLGPYLNEAMLILCEGVSVDRIKSAALAYGMPLSPLELIDTIGLRTTFNAGLSYCQAFPRRLDPAPVLARMIKLGRLGKHVQKGFFDYDSETPSLDSESAAAVERYLREPIAMTDEELVDRLMVPMMIEAAIMRRDGVVRDASILDKAIRGGLGFSPSVPWTQYAVSIPVSRIQRVIDRIGPHSSTLRLPSGMSVADMRLHVSSPA
jgi:3-hydroxyacyl-CoA dehydrogenase / enoyl-CoA hydratase / 3-hydroxybutyryl-CoA epimerase / enoyl-CoA isomerase